MVDKQFCRFCGAHLSEGARFCKNCGAELSRQFTQGEEIPQPTQQPQYEAPRNRQQIQYPNYQQSYQQSYQYQQPPPYVSQTQPGLSRKSPAVSAILSLLIAGLGQIYLGRFWRGAAWFIGGIILGILSSGILAIFIWIGAAIDAYLLAKDYNKNLGY